LQTLQPEQAEVEENVLKKAVVNTDIDPNANSDRVFGVTNVSNLKQFFFSSLTKFLILLSFE